MAITFQVNIDIYQSISLSQKMTNNMFLKKDFAEDFSTIYYIFHLKISLPMVFILSNIVYKSSTALKSSKNKNHPQKVGPLIYTKD